MSQNQVPRPMTDRSAQPFLQAMHQEMSAFLDKLHGRQLAEVSDFFDSWSVASFPALDIVETDGEIEVTAELPGIKEEDLDISISQGALLIKGEKSSDHEKTMKDFHVVERRYGSFGRQIPLGFTPDADAVEVVFADGVLKLTIAKPAEAKSDVRKIEISKI